MSHTETHQVTLSKPAKRNLQEKVIESNLTSLLASVNTKSLAVRGWIVERNTLANGKFWRQKFAPSGEYEYDYALYLNVTYMREDGKKPGSNELPSIIRTIASRAGQPAFGKWAVSQVDGSTYTPVEGTDVMEGAEALGYAEVDMPATWDDNFNHLFGLQAHIARVQRALEAGIQSDWQNRFHCALVGPPGCGKSDICRSIKAALGEDAVLEFDATATTAAGAIKELAEREILPRVIVIEEIEKADEKTMSFLLGVLDLRAEIRKTTARATIQRDTRLFAIATVNDVPLFNKLQAGALSSRFTNTIHFKRPSRETLALILTREVRKIDGDEAWIQPTLDYCESQGITDPRKVIAICLCGREQLVTGEYQKMLAETGEDNGFVTDAHV
jgi:hypothetical protein